jgi:hypothetical protein
VFSTISRTGGTALRRITHKHRWELQETWHLLTSSQAKWGYGPTRLVSTRVIAILETGLSTQFPLRNSLVIKSDWLCVGRPRLDYRQRQVPARLSRLGTLPASSPAPVTRADRVHVTTRLRGQEFKFNATFKVKEPLFIGGKRWKTQETARAKHHTIMGGDRCAGALSCSSKVR